MRNPEKMRQRSRRMGPYLRILRVSHKKGDKSSGSKNAEPAEVQPHQSDYKKKYRDAKEDLKEANKKREELQTQLEREKRKREQLERELSLEKKRNAYLQDGMTAGFLFSNLNFL